MARKRKVLLQKDDEVNRKLARKMANKGYEVLLMCPETEDIRPYPF